MEALSTFRVTGESETEMAKLEETPKMVQAMDL
jgi:hypothetical protein